MKQGFEFKIEKENVLENSTSYVIKIDKAEVGSIIFLEEDNSTYLMNIYICSKYSGFFIDVVDFVLYQKLILKTIENEKILDRDINKIDYKIDVNYLDEEKTIRKGEILFNKDEFKITTTFKDNLE